MLHTIFQTSLQHAQIHRYDEFFVTSLIAEDGRCEGVIGFDMNTGEVQSLAAKTVIWRPRQRARLRVHDERSICTGDGMSLAYRAGVP